MNINDAIQMALSAQQSGHLKSAENIYIEILKVHPDNVSALHFLGLIYYKQRDFNSASRYIKEALRLEPTYVEAHYNLGIIFQELGNHDEALACFRSALDLRPDYAEALRNLGAVLQSQGNLDGAITTYQKALQINPELPDVHRFLGYLFRDKGMLDEAIACFEKALIIQPDLPDVYNNLGIVYRVKGILDKAIACFQKALLIQPDLPDVYNNLAATFRDKGYLDEAIICFQKALQCNPDFTEALNNLGVALQEKREFDNAIACFKKALQINPYFASAHWNLALIHLLTANFEEGWKEYIWFWKLRNSPEHNFSQPLWEGSNINGKTILIYSEQGLGDTIQFIRFLPLITQRGAKVIVECQRELISLLQNMPEISGIIAPGENLPEFDIQCSLLMLPALLKTTLENIPAKIPYLTPGRLLVQKWHNKLICNISKLKIGIAWSGGHRDSILHLRACRLELFAQLAELDEVIFYSLQKGTGSEQAKNPPEGMELIDYTDEISDFSDTAALMQNLDLIISVDTAVAHLAGALGRPVWTLLPFSADWRWMLNREDSPWYPTMRLFRQENPSNWDGVFTCVYYALNEILKKNGHYIKN